MPYKTKSDLPESVQNVLPAHAQDIYKEAFNSAWEQYKDKADRRDDASREETAHKVAWAAVKNDYQKGDDDKWHKKRCSSSCQTRQMMRVERLLPCKRRLNCILSC